jgi:HAD superfamily hydrolase (TIGR01509 family)
MPDASDNAVIFDLGGVLVELHDDRVQAELRRMGASLRFQQAASWLDDDPAYWAHMRGEIDGPRFLRHLRDTLLPQADLQTVRRLWMARIGSAVPGMDALVGRLAGRAKLAVLSNTNDLHWAALTDGRYAFMRQMDRTYASFLLGLLKPSPEIYRHAVDDLSLPAGRCVFIDDDARNVAGARRVGMDAVQFTDAASLERQLRTRGILQP